MSAATAKREQRLRNLTEQVRHFDPSNPVHLAHFRALAPAFGEMGAAMLVSQDAAAVAEFERMTLGNTMPLRLTDPGEIGSHPHWRKLNRVVIHGSTARYTIFDFEADTRAGGRLIPMFTRDQTVPAYLQQD